MNSPIPLLLLIATLLPFAAFWVILLAGPNLKKDSASWISIFAILFAAALSFASLGIWLANHWPAATAQHGHDAHGEPHDGHHDAHSDQAHDHATRLSESGLHPVSWSTGNASADEKMSDEEAAGHPGESAHEEHHAAAIKPALSGTFYTLAEFGQLRMEFSYYVDTLTICMFCMVTLIASCIHFYASGYMHDELHEIHDHEVKLANGHELVRPGRYFRFFQYLSLFCFSMLGLVLAGNIALVFVFWELVGICSYFLIGFYIERKSASTAANKAFIVNRVGDFGMIIGLMALWSSLGTFSFGDGVNGEPGLFSLVRPAAAGYALQVPAGMARLDASDEIAAEVAQQSDRSLENIQRVANEKVAALQAAAENQGGRRYGYLLLVVAGIGIFCGCVGKSAQFPLHVWLPDAMEGPTPVSALVHSATMVAAGVYLVGRFYPVFAPEVLLVIATVGCITLFMAATIAITAVDIKRVLAYSTVSQLGYMMLALGVGGWKAGLMHLITHAFFKSLLFMCSGSVIHAVHTNDMRNMGGLLAKMPVTAITMLIGCLAIAGVGVPFVIGFSGYYSKDAILEQAYSLYLTNGTAGAGIFFFAAAGGAAITAFYMFRMWYLTFVGQPRDQERFDHAHESPAVMTLPLVVLSIFAIAVAWDFSLIGYALIAGAFFIARGISQGWFQPSPAAHSDHAAHGDHAAHDEAHHGAQHDGHGRHGHETHAASHHDAHDTHAAAGHHAGDDAHHDHAPSPPPFTTVWLATMLLCTLLGGRFVEGVLTSSAVAQNGFVQSAMGLSLSNLLEQARPTGTAADATGYWLAWTWPDEHKAHAPEIVRPVTLLATGTWIFGIGLATMMYAFNYLNPEEVRRQFQPIYALLWNKWWFDELYDAIFVQPAHVIGRFIAGVDRQWIDGLIHAIAAFVIAVARIWDRVADKTLIDGTVNLAADWIYSLGLQLRTVQTGRLRQYVMFIVVGALAVFVLVSFFWTPAHAG